jgi:uncharacterized membrane protein YgcG
MEFRNWIGIILVIIGTTLQVTSFYTGVWLTVISVLLITLGVFIFATQRYIAYTERDNYNYGTQNSRSSLPLIGDIFNLSGQRTGGRREGFYSKDSSSNGGFSDSGGSDGD